MLHSMALGMARHPDGPRRLNPPLYIVAPLSVWHSIPTDRPRLCKRVRLSDTPVDFPVDAPVYTLKIDAFECALATHQCVIREIQRPHEWSYELLLENSA